MTRMCNLAAMAYRCESRTYHAVTRRKHSSDTGKMRKKNILKNINKLFKINRNNNKHKPRRLLMELS